MSCLLISTEKKCRASSHDIEQFLLLALNVIHAAEKVSSQSDQQRTNCADGLHWLRSDCDLDLWSATGLDTSPPLDNHEW